MYGGLIQEHARRPRNVGSLAHPDLRHEAVNPLCGDRIRIEANLDHHQRIAEIRFRGDACMISQAAGSILTERVKGWPIEKIEALKGADVVEALQAPIRPSRVKCALLPLEILQSAIATYRRLHTVS